MKRQLQEARVRETLAGFREQHANENAGGTLSGGFSMANPFRNGHLLQDA
jgi:hypothetical protein